MTRPPPTKAPRCERSEEIDDGRMLEAICIAKAGLAARPDLFGYPNSKSTYDDPFSRRHVAHPSMSARNGCSFSCPPEFSRRPAAPQNPRNHRFMSVV